MKDEHGLPKRISTALPSVEVLAQLRYPLDLLEQAVRYMELTESNIPPDLDTLLNTDMDWVEQVAIYRWARDWKLNYHMLVGISSKATT